MSTPRDDRQKDQFRSALDQLIDLSRPMVRLACHIDWTFIEARLGEVYSRGAGPLSRSG